MVLKDALSILGSDAKHNRWVRCTRQTLEWSEYVLLKTISFIVILSVSACSKELVAVDGSIQTTDKSPYITKVFDYQYGPGQHAQLIPSNEKGVAFIGEPWINGKSFTSLGGWGGYIIAGFDHAVNNTTGPDIAVYTQPSVGSEPGVVYVMADNNNDGIPNDGPWLELKGSEYNNPQTIHNYQVTYYKPGASGYVTWKDVHGKEGSLVPQFGTGSWWWSGYGDKSSVTFSGEKLPDAYSNTSKDPAVQLWMPVSGLFRFGYAECYDNEDYNVKLKANLFDLSTAVDASGAPLNLSKISFIKVQSGVFQIAGWLNEISTEISGAADIHLLDKKSY
ncbi:MAG: hypothetical protein M0Q53_03145 [Prolixibacteraceae bacterium]|nr:hypothetical protein [Prolixibacteraceae bacterium]